jgi:hypothetical protein
MLFVRLPRFTLYGNIVALEETKYFPNYILTLDMPHKKNPITGSIYHFHFRIDLKTTLEMGLNIWKIIHT